MLALLFLSGSALLGVSLVRRALRHLLDGVEQCLWGVVTGWVLTTLAVFLIARREGQLSSRLVLWSTLAIWLVTSVLIFFELRHKRTFPGSVSKTFSRYIGLAVLLVLLAPLYWNVLSAQVFKPGAGGVSSGEAGNDLNFHAALITSFVYGQNLRPEYTLLPPQPLLYPYMPDFQAAILLAGGLSLRAALIVTALVLGAAVAGLFYSFAMRIARAPKIATLATLLFLLNGGLGFIDFVRDWWHSDQSTVRFWSALTFNYAKFSERGLHWTNIVADMMVPQRTSLFGLSLGLMILTLFAVVWQRWHENDAVDEPKPRTWILMIIAGALAGILPLFHTHTYIAVGLASVGLFAMRPKRAWLLFWAPAILLALPQLFALGWHARDSGIVRLFFGWLGHDARFFPLYLLRNFGLPLILAIPAWWAAPKEWRKFYLAFLFLFIFSFVVVFSPNLFDNGKLTYYWHAVNSVLVARWLVKIANAHWKRALVVLVAFLSIATALLVFHTETVDVTRVFTDEEMSAVDFVRSQTAPHAMFLTAPALKSPVLSLAGRPVVRGATAWL